MAYYSESINLNELIDSSQGNDTNGSITGYIGFPLSQSVPDSYNYHRIPQPLGYKKNGVDLAKTSNGTSNCNAITHFFSESEDHNLNVTNYNYMSGVVVGGGGGGGFGGGSNYAAGGGGGGGSGAFYMVNISNSNNITITVGSGGKRGNEYANYGYKGGSSLVTIPDGKFTSNGGDGGGGASVANGGDHGTCSANGNFINVKNSNFNAGNDGEPGWNNGDRGGNGGGVGNWNVALANASFGTGGKGGTTAPYNEANSGNDYGGGGGGGSGSNGGANYGGSGAKGYVQIWLYKD